MTDQDKQIIEMRENVSGLAGHHNIPLDDEVVVESAFAGLSRYKTVRVFHRCVGYVLLACVCALNDGYEFSIPNSVINIQAFINQFGTSTTAAGVKVIDPSIVSLWSGLQQAAVAIGQVIAALINDRTGRKGAMYILTLFFVIGAVLSCVAQEWQVWLAARFLFGIGMGMTQVTVTTYVSELAPTQIRGTLLAVYSLGFALGQFFSSICLKVLQEQTPNLWRRACYTQWIFIGFWMIIVPFLPESPWYLARCHRDVAARQSLMRLYKNVPNWDLETEYAVLQAEIAHAERLREESRAAKWIEIFQGSNGRRTLASITGPAMQQLVGVPIFFTYLTYFFAQSGIKDPFQASVIQYVLLLVGIVISFWTTELVGRRPLLLWGGVIMCLTNIGLGLSGSFKTLNSSAALAMSCIWVFTYALTSAPVAFIVSGEMSSPRLRALTNGLAIFVYGALGTMFTFVVPYMLDAQHANWGVKAAYVFAGGCIISLLAVYFLLPESAGRTFAELDELWESGVSVRRFKTTETTSHRIGAFERKRIDG